MDRPSQRGAGDRREPPVPGPRPPHRRPVPVGRGAQLRGAEPPRGARARVPDPAPGPSRARLRVLHVEPLSMESPRSQVRAEPAGSLWYKDAIIYEVHVRAFADSNADGIGDLRG